MYNNTAAYNQKYYWKNSNYQAAFKHENLNVRDSGRASLVAAFCLMFTCLKNYYRQETEELSRLNRYSSCPAILPCCNGWQ